MIEANLPSGLWAIANALSPAQLDAWMVQASSAAAWTFRRPRCSEHQALKVLRRMQPQTPFLAVHGRSDWALASRAQALIAGAHSLPWPILADRLERAEIAERAAEVRLGASVHDQEEARRAHSELGAEFLLYGPVFDTPSKQGVYTARGLDQLAEFTQLGLPIIAIGGFERPEQVVAAHQAGAHAVAVLRAVEAGSLPEMAAAWGELSRPSPSEVEDEAQ